MDRHSDHKVYKHNTLSFTTITRNILRLMFLLCVYLFKGLILDRLKMWLVSLPVSQMVSFSLILATVLILIFIPFEQSNSRFNNSILTFSILIFKQSVQTSQQTKINVLVTLHCMKNMLTRMRVANSMTNHFLNLLYPSLFLSFVQL